MRIAFAPVVAAVVVLLHSPAFALEKRSVPFNDNRADAWSAGATCRVSYYNICTGWVWCWGGFDNWDRFGVVADRCCEGNAVAYLLQSSLFLCTASPVYYGFTGTIAVHSVDANDCPTSPPIAVQPYLPWYVESSSFSVITWGSVPVPNRFAVVVTFA